MKYINIENNISRLLPNMSKDDIAKYFNNQEPNCFVKRVPQAGTIRIFTTTSASSDQCTQ